MHGDPSPGAVKFHREQSFTGWNVLADDN